MDAPTDPVSVPRSRRHGRPPRRLVVVHGGPGAPGMVGALARELATDGTGVLEPLQAAHSVDGQVDELAATLEAEGHGQAQAHGGYLAVGSSWGAMLAVLTAQRHPELFSRLVLVGCAPFDATGGSTTAATRSARMPAALRAELQQLEHVIAGPDPQRATAAFARSADLLLAVDHHDPIVDHLEVIAHQLEVFHAVWGEATRRRAAGTLLDPAAPLSCPVLVLHGDHDPHPLTGVVEPLQAIAGDLSVQVLERCGHLPWLERDARERFLTLLRAALRAAG
jgi:pimeloyl-ACP methyl ester carboxylesterase